MQRILYRLFFTLLTISFLLSACAQNNLQIGYSVNLCCPGDYAQYRNFRIELQDMPAFLSDYVKAEFEMALTEKGLQRNDVNSDISVRLSYRHINLNPEQESIDPFDRQSEQDITLRYIATIMVDIFDTSGKQVWGGQINRIHTVSPGEYMHEEGARPAFLATFRELLQRYPTI